MAAKTVGEIIRALEKRAPSSTAESWDNVGLLAGDPDWKTPGAVVSVDLTAEAIQQALKKKYRLIVNHHPCIFPKSRGLSRVTARAGTPGLVFEALRNGIAVAAFHTNFDRCSLEVVERICDALEVNPEGRLLDSPSGALVKLAVFVPHDRVDPVRDALCAAGAGRIGNYDSCTFGAEGEGTFRGKKNANPFLGKPGTLERAKEVRLETIFPAGLEGPVLDALRKAHPYEEMAYDLYAVQQRPTMKGLARGLGYGFYGKFRKPKLFSEVVKDVTRIFNANGLLLTNSVALSTVKEPAKKAKKVAFVAGKGASFLEAAAQAGCDLFITGEVGYHGALDGARRGVTVMEIGHRESERFFLLTMKEWLARTGLGREKIVELNSPTQQFVI